MAAKQPPSMDSIIQTKGASRPDAIPQRGAASASPSQAPITPPPEPPKPARVSPEPKAKSLTLRLSETQYQRLRRFAFDRGLTHQDVLEQALMEHLNKD